MQYTKGNSINPDFNRDIYSICPACCKIAFADMRPSEINRLCDHHRHAHTQFLIIKYKDMEDEFNERKRDREWGESVRAAKAAKLVPGKAEQPTV